MTNFTSVLIHKRNNLFSSNTDVPAKMFNILGNTPFYDKGYAGKRQIVPLMCEKINQIDKQPLLDKTSVNMILKFSSRREIAVKSENPKLQFSNKC